MGLTGYDLNGAAETLGQWIAKGLRDAAQAPRVENPPVLSRERVLYNSLLIAGNSVKVRLVSGGELYGELTALEDTGLVLAYSNPIILDRVGEALLRVIPYSSVLYVSEQLPESDDE